MVNILKVFLISLIILSPALVLGVDAMPLNEITVRFDLRQHLLRGTSRIFLGEVNSAVIDLSGLKVLSASIGGRELILDEGKEKMAFSPGSPDEVLTIEYTAEFSARPEADIAGNPGVVRGNLVNEEGIVLLERWYPAVEGASRHRLTAVLPTDFEAVSEAEEVTVSEKTDVSREFVFSYPFPLDSLSLVAGRYVVEREVHKGTELYAYFLQEDQDLAGRYLEETKKYLDLYEKLLGPFPFRRFSIVENLLPTGYAMPTFTLLGREVVRLPFIAETSLGHEFLHQWFGGIVRIDYEKGNWAEGLTTYLADHLYEEFKDKGWEYRKKGLMNFQSYVSPEMDFPLVSFLGRTDRASSAIGYGKASMVFHMLRNMVGEERFFDGLREFISRNSHRAASWNSLREAFESTSKRDLGWYFSQWLEGKGAPEISVRDIAVRYEGAKTLVTFEIVRKGGDFRLFVPVTLRSPQGEVKRMFEIEKEKTPCTIEWEGSPRELVVDENYDLFRRLPEPEFPPVISRLLGDRERLLVIPKGREGDFADLSENLGKEGFLKKREEEVTHEDLRSLTILIPGVETEIVKKLLGKVETGEGDQYLLVRSNPLDPARVVAVYGSSPAETLRLLRRASHYGSYSTIAFREGRNVLKTAVESERGMRHVVTKEVMGIEVPRATTLQEIMERVRDKDIIYVGERHDRFDHHRVQLEVIRELHRRKGRIAIGMEMFQKPFQEVLDAYVNGEIDERALLKRSEYFTRWGFDYKLYREILLYARENKIPVIALNIAREIVSKVSKEGIHSLTEKERAELPEFMDLSDQEYRRRLREIFRHHAGSPERNFDFFFQSQVLWDESMAHNLDAFLREHPDRQVVVLAGGGHLAFGSGIPRRAHRLNGRPHAVIMMSEEAEKGIADYVLYPEQLDAPETPRLMVQLSEEAGRVKITAFTPGSISEKAGLAEGDVIRALDDTDIASINDVRIFLLDREKGDTVTVRVLRKRFLLGETERVIDVTL